MNSLENILDPSTFTGTVPGMLALTPALMIANSIVSFVMGRITYWINFILSSLHRLFVIRFTLDASSYETNQEMIDNLIQHINGNRLTLQTPFYRVYDCTGANDEMKNKKLELDSGSFLFVEGMHPILANISVSDQIVAQYSMQPGKKLAYKKGISFSCLRWSYHRLLSLLRKYNDDAEEEKINKPEVLTISDYTSNPMLMFQNNALTDKLKDEEKKKSDNGKPSIGFFIAPSNFTGMGKWLKFCDLDHTDYDHIIVPENLKKTIETDYTRFSLEETKMMYRVRNIHPKRSYLLYGKPGGGKTSFVKAFASAHRMNIYELSNSMFSSMQTLRIMLGEVPENSLILVEDLDVIFPNRELEMKKLDGLEQRDRLARENELDKRANNMSEFFNIIDGVVPVINNSVIFFTTNHIDRLDPAFKRPGRMDIKVIFDYLEPKGIEDMFMMYFPDQKELAATMMKQLNGMRIMPAYLSEYLRRSIFNEPESVIRGSREWFEEMEKTDSEMVQTEHGAE